MECLMISVNRSCGTASLPGHVARSNIPSLTGCVYACMLERVLRKCVGVHVRKNLHRSSESELIGCDRGYVIGSLCVTSLQVNRVRMY